MIRLDRSRKGQDIWLGEKMIFFAVGAALGVAGMVTGLDWLIWLAIAVLIIGFLLRLLGRRAGGGSEAPPPEEQQDSDWAREYEDEDEDKDKDEDKDEDKV